MSTSNTSTSTEAFENASLGFTTRALHSGQNPDPVTGAITVPISLASTFVQASPGQHTGFEYSRTGNPTRAAFEKQLASLEKAKYALAFASGSATTGTIIQTLLPGDHVISIDDVYGGTNRFFQKVAVPTMQIKVDFIDTATEDAEALKSLLQSKMTAATKILWIETPTNPTLKVTDISAVAKIAHDYNPELLVIVDNTFASPYLQNPLALGADIVVHSVTKYIGGHSDVVMGILATNNEAIYTKLKFLQNAVGAIPAPFDAYMAMRGLKTLSIRMDKHCDNALAIARLLESRSDIVDKVIYPGLASHPSHATATKQMIRNNSSKKPGYGGMITFYVKGGVEQARVFLESLRIFAIAESLGAVESLAESPIIMTHAAVPEAQRKLLNISETLIRLSVGIEDEEDLIADITQALEKTKLTLA